MSEVIEQRVQPLHDEAVRQLTICNSCRYCEGYCSAFKALTRHRSFDKPTVTHLANLCHNCRGCFYACQYTEPHEFKLNIPAILANVRAENWEQHIKPSGVSRVMQASFVCIGLFFGYGGVLGFVRAILFVYQPYSVSGYLLAVVCVAVG